MKKIIAILLAFLLIISTFSINIAAATKDDLAETGATATGKIAFSEEPKLVYNIGEKISIKGSLNDNKDNKLDLAFSKVSLYLDNEFLDSKNASFGDFELGYNTDNIFPGNHTLTISAEKYKGLFTTYEFKSIDFYITINEAPIDTDFVINSEPDSYYKGQTSRVNATLQTKAGTPIPNQEVEVFLDEDSLGSKTTGDNGEFTCEFTNPQELRSCKLTFEYKGITISGKTYNPKNYDHNFTIIEDREATISMTTDIQDKEKGGSFGNIGSLSYNKTPITGQEVKCYLDQKDDDHFIKKFDTGRAGTFTFSASTTDPKFTLGSHKFIFYWEGGIVDGHVYKPVSKSYPFEVYAKISYNPNGGKIGGSGNTKIETIYNNRFATEHPTPTRENYIFLGWTKTRNGQDFVTDDISESETLYAKWEEANSIERGDDGELDPSTNTDPLYLIGASIRGKSNDKFAGLRFLIRISNQYRDLDKVEYGCALFTKDAFLEEHTEDDELLATSAFGGKTAGKKINFTPCYEFTEYNIYSVVIASNNLLEEPLYSTNFIARPYIKYTDGNGKDQYIYYTELVAENKCGGGYFTSYAETLGELNAPSQNVPQQVKEVPVSSGVKANDNAIAQTGAVDSTYILGDANEDNVLSIVDSTFIQLSLVGLTDKDVKAFNTFRFKADADQNNCINISDTTAIQQRLAKITNNSIGSRFELPIDPLDGTLWSRVVKK